MSKRGWNLKAPYKVILWGDQFSQWKGDDASPSAKRTRARKRFKHLGICEKCGKKSACDRHHIDANTGNNVRSNIMFLCRRCHMEIDGRLEAFIHSKRNSKSAQPCKVCGRLAKPLRKGRCGACAERFRRNGFDTAPRGKS